MLDTTEQQMLAFCRARIDEAAAPRPVPQWHEPWCLDPSGNPCFYCGQEEDPDKVELVPRPPDVLADLEARRKRLQLLEDALSVGHDSYDLASALLPLEAASFREHPDYKETWRP